MHPAQSRPQNAKACSVTRPSVLQSALLRELPRYLLARLELARLEQAQWLEVGTLLAAVEVVAGAEQGHPYFAT